MPSELRKARDRVRSERKREALLDAAVWVFVRHGYHRTLISDITARAKVGQGTFYRHFSEKRDVFEAIFDRFCASLFAEFTGMSEHPPTNIREYRDSSVAAIKRVAGVLEQNRDLARFLIREAPTVDRRLEHKLATLYEGFVDLAQTYLDHAVARGFARQCRTRVIARAIVSMAVMMSDAWWGGRIRDVSLDQLIEEVVDFAFTGLGNRGATTARSGT